MDLYFITGARFHRGTDGQIYAGEMSFSNILYERFLKKFDKVYIIARLFEGADNVPKEHIVNNAEILPLPAFESAIDFLKKRAKIKHKIEEYLQRDGAVLMKGGGELAHLASNFCKRHSIPYAIEVIGDPYDVFAPGVVKHPLRFLFRHLFTYIQKKVVYNASSVMYVTKFSLQRRYPAKKGAFSSYATGVFIDQTREAVPKTISKKDTYSLISIGALDQLYKAPDICIRVVAEMKKRGINTHLRWLGKGKYMEEMKILSQELGVGSQIDFMGSVTKEEVDRYLDESDVFLLLSRTEGLPRAMVEALARALPCVGSNVGGIPELIDSNFLVPINNVEITCQKLQLLLQQPDIYHKQSVTNLETSKEYSPSVLDQKRDEFYESIKQMK